MTGLETGFFVVGVWCTCTLIDAGIGAAAYAAWLAWRKRQKAVKDGV